MKTRTVNSYGSKTKGGGRIVFWMLALLHYVSGISGIIACTMLAISNVESSRNMAGMITLVCIIFFGAYKPNIKYRKVDTDWPFLEKKINRLAADITSATFVTGNISHK